MGMFKNNRPLIIIFVSLLIVDIFLILARRNRPAPVAKPKTTWEIQSVDTVKYSRDVARQHQKNQDFDSTIEKHIQAIAGTGANYIALGTPYDEEFVPYLKRWVDISRKYGLKIWFRGNFSGWEGWFDYPTITQDEHKEMLKNFILDNGGLFNDGDLFTSCTECENGGPGDPRKTGDVDEYRKFLIDEYQISRGAFTQIGKSVSASYYPMNFDVALLVMNSETTQSLGGVVVIDHYVATPEILTDTIKTLEDSSGGKIILGEFGAPIPDIHGSMSEEDQAEWIEKSLTAISKDINVIGVNYWTAFGGSTRIWKENGTPTAAVAVLQGFYNPQILAGFVQNEAGYYIKEATAAATKETKTNSRGEFSLPYTEGDMGSKITVKADGYITQTLDFPTGNFSTTIVLQKERETLFFKLEKFLYKKFKI
jgi:hypothetical protein